MSWFERNTEVEGPRHPNPRFIAALMAAAALLLGVGASLRPHTAEQTTAVPSNELATLPELSQRRALRDLADYMTERSNASAGSVIYLPELQASALVVGPDSALTAIAAAGDSPGAGAPVRLLKVPLSTTDPVQRVTFPGDEEGPRIRWAIAVARAPEGRILSVPGLVTGRVDARCGDLELGELLFDAVVPPAFKGGGVFDLDGNPVALVVPCGNRSMLVPLSDIARAIEQQRSTAYRVWAELGFRADSSSGLRVSEVRPRSSAARAGLRAGDLIVRAGSAPAMSVEDLSGLLSSGRPARLVMRRTSKGVLLHSVPDSTGASTRHP